MGSKARKGRRAQPSLLSYTCGGTRKTRTIHGRAGAYVTGPRYGLTGEAKLDDRGRE